MSAWDAIKNVHIWPSGTLRSSLPIVGEVEKSGLVNAIVSCTYLHTRNSDMNRKDVGYLVEFGDMSIAKKMT